MKKFLLFCALLAAQQAAAQGFGADPSALYFSATRGTTQTRVMRVFNTYDYAVQARIYMGDWLRDTTGEHFYSPPGTLPNSCSRWMSASEEYFEVPPKSSKNIVVTLALPDSAATDDSMRWAMVFVETNKESVVPTSDAKVRTVVESKFRVAVHAYQTPPGIKERGIKLLSFSPELDSNNNCRAVCRNTGKVMIKAKAQLDLSHLESGEKTSVKLDEFPLFPNQRRIVTFPMPAGLAKGKYNALAFLDAGEDLPLEAAEAVVEIK